MFFLFNMIFAALSAVLDNLFGTTLKFNIPGQGEMLLPYGYFYFTYTVTVLIPGIAVGARRFHDIGKSGWWYFVIFIPCLGIFPFIYFMVKAGHAGENQYGPDPKA